jgi:hypothetical protein
VIKRIVQFFIVDIKLTNINLEQGFILVGMLWPVWSYWSPIGCLPRWLIGERSPDMGGTGEIKYPRQTKTSTAALRFAEGSVRARGRKPRRQITWFSRLGVV